MLFLGALYGVIIALLHRRFGVEVVIVLGEQYKNSGIFQTFCKDEITELLPKTARIQLDRRQTTLTIWRISAAELIIPLSPELAEKQ